MPASSSPPPPVRTVLYVEDNEVNAMLLSALFQRRPDLQLVVAASGQQALCIARELRPSLLLLDLRLPDCHGSQLLPLLRLSAGCEQVPAIAVTADGIFDIDGTGFSELWPKPLDLHHVLRRLQALLPVQPSAGGAVNEASAPYGVPGRPPSFTAAREPALSK